MAAQQPIRSALLVFKKSAWELHVAGKKGTTIPDAATRRAMLRAHKDNAAAMVEVMRVLEKAGVAYRATARAELAHPVKHGSRPDLIVSIGGDGTFLAASHQVEGGRILGVNSSPEHSVGFFCGAKRETFAKIFAGVMDGTISEVDLSRLEVRVNGARLPRLALNDVLITHSNPGATSRYALEVGKIRELQRSSGIWISTAAGSTAGIRAAGGRVLPLLSDRMQFAVRELYVPPGLKPFRLQRGLAPRNSEIRVVCRMVAGALFIDGPRNPLTLGVGDKISVHAAKHPLRVLGIDRRRGRH